MNQHDVLIKERDDAIEEQKLTETKLNGVLELYTNALDTIEELEEKYALRSPKKMKKMSIKKFKRLEAKKLIKSF